MRIISQYIVLFIMSIASVEAFSYDVFTTPVIYYKNHSYINLSFKYKKLDEGMLINKSFEDAVYSLRDALKANNSDAIVLSYVEEDGSRNVVKQRLALNQTAPFEMHKRLKRAEYDYVIKWGDYFMASSLYDVEGAGAYPWREDFICKGGRCFISTNISANSRSQLFEVAYLHFTNKRKKSTSIEMSSLISHSSIKILPAGLVRSSESIKNPLTVAVGVDKHRYKICLSCDEDNQKEDGLLGIKTTLLNMKKIHNDKGEVGLVEWIGSYDSSFTKNMVIQKIRWEKDKPRVVQMNNKAYFNELMNNKELLILGSMRAEKYLYVFFNEESLYKKNSSVSKEKNENKDFDIMIFKLEQGKPPKPLFTPINDYSDNVLYSTEVLHAIYKLLNDKV